MMLWICLMLLVASDLGFCLDEDKLDAQWEQWKITHGKEYNAYGLFTGQRRKNEEEEWKITVISLRKLRDIVQRERRGATEAACSSWARYMDGWMDGKARQGKDEEDYRKDIWKKNFRMIEERNLEAEQGKHSYKVGMNQYGDMTLEEMTEKMMCKVSKKNQANFCHYNGRISESFYKTEDYNQTMRCIEDYKSTVYSWALPKSIDYRERGMVTRVKGQGSCGSCWAFSAVGALEGQLAKTTGQLLDLSPQNLVDCVQKSKGCDGGSMSNAFKYVQENGGINSEEDYPYVKKKQHCRYKPSAVAARCKGFKQIPEGDERALAEALYNVGPLSVAMDCSHVKFMLYRSGVYYNPECDKEYIDHAMLLVGYGETAKEGKYWIVKNSFGATWGEEGYVRIARNCDNHCGIASDASYPVM